MKVNVIKRPMHLCKDNSQSESAIKHVLEKINFTVDNIIFLQATSPLRKPKDIDNAFKEFLKKRQTLYFQLTKQRISLMFGKKRKKL